MYWIINLLFMMLFAYLFGSGAGILSGIQTITVTGIAFILMHSERNKKTG